MIAGPAAWLLARHLAANPLPDRVHGSLGKWMPVARAAVEAIERAGEAFAGQGFMSADGHADMGSADIGASSGEVEEVGTKEAARMIGISERHVRRVLDAGDLAGHQVGRTWLVPKHEVQAYLAQRRDHAA